MGLDLKWISIGCDGIPWYQAQRVWSLNTDFPALIKLLKQANDLKATETYSCFKERKFVDYSEMGIESQMRQHQRADNCRETCAERHESYCKGEFFLSL